MITSLLSLTLTRKRIRETVPALSGSEGSAILEFAITIPLLVVFVVGIYDFAGAFNQKLKIEQAAQEGAIVAAAQPTSDIEQSNLSPVSLQPIVTAVFNSLTASGVLAAGCTPTITSTHPSPLTWAYSVSGCSGSSLMDSLSVTISRGWACSPSAPSCSTAPPTAIGSTVTVNYPYHWRFNSVIQLLIPGATYAAVTQVQETATTHNQM
jgi:TadE-like protein